MGINDRGNISECDENLITRFENNLTFKNGRYETKLFWDKNPSKLHNNFEIAKRRFEKLCMRMKENNWLYNEYTTIVADQLNLNIVEEWSSNNEGNSFHMPHSAVVRTDKETTKVRMVFDASPKGKGHKSLNDCLAPGPPLNPKILDVLLRFREFVYAFCSDIQGAFLTIGIAEEDRDYLRFFWFPDKQDSKSYKILRMTRVPFGVTSSPFMLAATISTTFENINKSEAKLMKCLIHHFM
ncbi:hypothetical protein AVEN_54267-1 [Araneus ventricosus]|uniref:Reverse transcriptase domain-containing protein n=1 Tax=Araneus ventricosus TaxID=182803 RepID=A0A4Y2LSP3_ARAVE|nr:hypothetical protein AVEN_54267-1 [Araneus ventricosus]